MDVQLEARRLEVEVEANSRGVPGNPHGKFFISRVNDFFDIWTAFYRRGVDLLILVNHVFTARGKR